MIYYILVNLCLLAILVFLCFFVWDSILANIRSRYIDVPTSRKARKNIFSILGEIGIIDGVFYDLGSGRGAMSLSTKRAFPEMKVHGFDRSRFKIFLSRVRSFLSGIKVFFKRTDIFNIDIGMADIIYLYIWPTSIPEIKDKIEREAKKGVVVISNTFPIQDWEPALIRETLSVKNNPSFEKIYVYRR